MGQSGNTHLFTTILSMWARKAISALVSDQTLGSGSPKTALWCVLPPFLMPSLFLLLKPVLRLIIQPVYLALEVTRLPFPTLRLLLARERECICVSSWAESIYNCLSFFAHRTSPQ